MVLGSNKFSSPREEALEIARDAMKAIVKDDEDAVSTLRACLIIASTLNKEDDKKWIKQELDGYSPSDEFPSYRLVRCPYTENKLDYLSIPFKVVYNVHLLQKASDDDENVETLVSNIGYERTVHLTRQNIDVILAKIINRCLEFLNGIIAELQYGGVVEFLMEEIRKMTDEKLAKLDSTLTNEANSLYLNLASTNPADWNKVGLSCRRMLKLLADKVFPADDKLYKTKNGMELNVDDSAYVNRIHAFLDQKTGSDESKLVVAETEYLESYLHQVNIEAQKVVHKPSIEKFLADRLAIHTYLILSEVLRYVPTDMMKLP